MLKKRAGNLACMAICVSMFCPVSFATSAVAQDCYKMISTVEYLGQGQFRNQTETVFAVSRDQLGQDTVKYVLQAGSLDENGVFSSAGSDIKGLSFMVNNSNQSIQTSAEFSLLGEVSNQCVKALSRAEDVRTGKTWKESIGLSEIKQSPVDRLVFTMTAVAVEKEGLGEMVAVRALSEPFTAIAENRPVTGRINTVYLFDKNIKTVYFAATVFEAATVQSSNREVVRYEFATYKLDSRGNPIDLKGLGADFEQLTGKLKLSGLGLKVTNSVPLPQWCKTTALTCAQVANTCSSISCEGALNPVAMVTLPAARVIDYQRTAEGELATVSAPLAAVSPLRSASEKKMNIFEQIKANWGWNIETASVVGGAAVGTVALAGGFSSGSSSHPAASE